MCSGFIAAATDTGKTVLKNQTADSGSIHYDNVAPCFLGGMQLMIEENDIISQQVPGFDEWLWVLAYPGIKVSTAYRW